MRAYDEAKVIPNIQQLLMKITGFPRKEDVDKLAREISRLSMISKENKEDIEIEKERIDNFKIRFDEFEEETNQDMGSVKGSVKWCEGQITMMKKMMQRITTE